MPAIAFSAASFDLYFPIIFMPAVILVTTEHVWVVVSRPTKYVSAVRAKAGVTNVPIRMAATKYFLILVSPWDELSSNVASVEEQVFLATPNQLFAREKIRVGGASPNRRLWVAAGVGSFTRAKKFFHISCLVWLC
jgi:hypothetical protein